MLALLSPKQPSATPEVQPTLKKVNQKSVISAYPFLFRRILTPLFFQPCFPLSSSTAPLLDHETLQAASIFLIAREDRRD